MKVLVVNKLMLAVSDCPLYLASLSLIVSFFLYF